MRVVLRNYRVVVRIASFDQTAYHAIAIEHKHSVAFIKFDRHRALFLRQKVFEQCSRFFGKDEGSTFVTLGSQRLATYQLVAVRSHHCDIFCCNIEINTVHHRAEFGVGSSEDRAVDSPQQHFRFHFHTNCVVTQCSRLRKFVCILSH